ncbi:phage tail protein [Campylobacter devanensis]|uniref:phage tail protein n=1 Tax=Campylobacter devanensis TaxID=3161138 RepID=UPI000A34C7B1|nr:phage tail protein [Campylobacter sp. P148]
MSNIQQKYYTIVSNKGKQAVIKALANKELIDLTTMSVGDGESPIDTNWESLPNEKDKFGINQIKIVDNITLEVTGILSASKGGYMITQAGLYTRDNILFAIAQLPQTAKPVLSDGASKDMTIKFVITIADTSVVNLSIDPNINIITQSHLDEVIDALKKETTTNLATKADKANTYTKTEVNNLVNAKANQATTYTKTEVNNLVNAKANSNAVVALSGNQTVAGVKTFSAVPVVASQPTNANQVANKAYVDSKLGKAYITETYSNGVSWYRVWSDKWCEQGGTINTTDKTITFLKSFKDTDYTLVGVAFRIADVGQQVLAKYVDKFKTWSAKHACGTSSWYACGYIE